jgi:hypothetical protein
MRKNLDSLLVFALASCQAHPEKPAPEARAIAVEQIARRCLSNSVRNAGSAISQPHLSALIRTFSFKDSDKTNSSTYSSIISPSGIHYESIYAKHKNDAGGYDLHYAKRVYKLDPKEVVRHIIDEIGMSPTMSIKLGKIDGCDNPDYILSYSADAGIGGSDVYMNDRCVVAPVCSDQTIACKPADNRIDYLHISVRYLDRSHVTVVDFVPIEPSGMLAYDIEVCRPGLVDPFNT